MAKFNEVQKKKRAQIAERKRATKGDPHTRKLKNKPPQQSLSVSGKRKRKLFKKWRRVISLTLPSPFLFAKNPFSAFRLFLLLVLCHQVPFFFSLIIAGA